MIATEQVPGLYRRMVGEVLVTAISDGHVVFPPGLLQNVSIEEADSIMRAAGRRAPFTTAVNVFLLQWQGRTVLVDTGAGQGMGPTCGKLMRNLRDAGLSAADVDAVLLTHLHSDHTGGLLDDSGLAVFPRAQLFVAETEIAFWLDDAAMLAMPEARRGTFHSARQAVAAYGDRVVRFTGSTPLPGVHAVPLPGHTPGHTGFSVGTGPDQLLIWGDVLHVGEVQAALPHVTLPFDTNQAMAAKTRLDVLERAVAEDLLVAGMHMNFPAFARIARSGGGYVVQPEVWHGAVSGG